MSRYFGEQDRTFDLGLSDSSEVIDTELSETESAEITLSEDEQTFNANFEDDDSPTRWISVRSSG